MLTAALLVAAVAVAVAALNFWLFRDQRNGEWHPMDFRGRMRRYVRGRWYYRDMTRDEMDRDQSR